MRLAPLRWIGLRLSSAFFLCIESKEQRAQRLALEKEEKAKARLTRRIQLLQCKIGALEKEHQAVRLKMASCSSPQILRTYSVLAKKLAINIRDHNKRMASAIQALATVENSRGVLEDIELLKDAGLIAQANTADIDVTAAITEYKMGSAMLEQTDALYDHVLEDDEEDEEVFYSLGNQSIGTLDPTRHGPSAMMTPPSPSSSSHGKEEAPLALG